MGGEIAMKKQQTVKLTEDGMRKAEKIKEKMMRAAGAVAVAAMLAVAAAGCSPHEKKAERAAAGDVEAIKVKTERVSLERRPATAEATGTVASGARSVLSAKVSGHVKRTLAEVGDRVAKGSLLAELDSREIEAAVEQARQGVEAAEQGAQEADEGVAAARAGVDAARAADELAAATFARYEKLLAEKSVSKQEHEQMEAKRKMAAAELARARNGLAGAEAGRRRAGAMAEQARQALRQADVMRSHAAVKAPFAGIVTEKQAETGQLAGPGAPLYTIEDDADYRLEAAVEESMFSHVAVGDEVEVELDALAGKPFAGRVAEISPTVDPSSRKFIVKIKLPGESRARSGMYGRARFAMGEEETLTAPAGAMSRRGQMEGAFVAGADGRAHFRVAKVGRRRPDGRVEILSGLAEGDLVITSGTDRLRDGMKVEIEQR